MDLLHIIVGISLILLGVSGTIYFLSTRPYQSPESVAQSYDQWTKDGILEFYWGEHIHLGYYIKEMRDKGYLRKNFIPRL